MALIGWSLWSEGGRLGTLSAGKEVVYAGQEIGQDEGFYCFYCALQSSKLVHLMLLGSRNFFFRLLPVKNMLAGSRAEVKMKLRVAGQ